MSQLLALLRHRSPRLLFSLLSFTVIASSLVALVFQPQGVAQAAPVLTITPLTWNVIGLDSNNVNVGPSDFPVGARVCNTSLTDTATNVSSTFVWDTANAYIDLRAGSNSSYSSYVLPPLNCVDFYYEVEITRNSAAYNATRRYHITASSNETGTLSTPVPREVFVEHLVSQNRNAVTDVILDGDSIPAGGAMDLLVGNTYTLELVGSTATNGYEQIESFINFPNTIFQVNSVTTTYTANAGTDSAAATKPYADGCGWINNPTSPNYRSCTGTGKYGGNITVTYNVTIIGGGGTNQTLNTLIYDFSGSSYHYNADFSSGARIAAIVDPAASLTFSKAFSPASTAAGGTSTLTFLISNPTSSTITGLNFTDDLPTVPAAMTVATTPNAVTSGCGSPTFAPTGGSPSISFSDGTLAPNGACVISLTVSVPAAPTSGTYSNASNSLFVGSLDTGKFATADLTVSATLPGTGICGQTLAAWDFPSGFATAGPAPTVANVAASALPGAGINSIDSTQNNSGSTHSWGSNGAIAAGAVLDTGNNDYFEFAIDTTGYSSVELSFAARRTNNGPQSLAVYYGTSATPPGSPAYDMPGFISTAGTWFPSSDFGTLSFSSGLNPSGLTYFRIYAYNAGNSVPGSDVYLDDVTFTGCGAAGHPTISKTFLTDPIAVGANSTLRFTLTNPNAVQLTGVEFTDDLPAGLEVAATPNASTTCGGSPSWTPSAGGTSLVFGDPAGGIISASGSCTVSVNITATTSGPHTNVSGFISSAESGTNSGSSGSATATLTALQPPVISKLFSPNPILEGGTSTLTFTISNPNLNDDLPAVAFTDVFPAGLSVALAPAVSQCNGTVTSTSGSITLSDGSVPAGDTCTVTVDVTAAVAGGYVNTSGAVSTTIAGVTSSGNTASDTLTVNAADPGISLLKQVSTSASGPWSQFITVAPGADVYYQFTIENTGDVPFSPVSVTDAIVNTAGCSWPASLPVADAADDDHIAVCVVGPITALTGDNPNTATAHGTYSGTVYDSTPSDASYLGATAGFSLLKQVAVSASGPWSSSVSGISPGSDLYFKFTIVNTGSLELDTINITDPDVSTASCTFTDPLPVNDATTCVVGPITASLSAGTYTNTAVAHGTNSGTTYDTAPSSADYTVTTDPPDLTLDKSNDTSGSGEVGTPFTWALTISNPGSGDATFADGQRIVSDPLPAGATYGVPSAGSFSGITNSGNLSCTVTSGTLRCNAAGAAVTIGASGSFTVSFNATPTASGSLINTASVDPLGNVSENDETNNSDSDTVTVASSAPEMTVAKTADVPDVDAAGDVISYTITLDNTGNVLLTGVGISDPLLADLDCDGTPGAPYLTSGFTINVGSDLTCTGTYTVLQSDLDDNGGGDGDLDNTVTAGSDQTADVAASETVAVVQSPSQSIAKAADVTDVDEAGDIVTYTVTLTNTGNLTLTGVSVSDPLLADLDCDGAPGVPFVTAGFTINVGLNLICTGTYTALQSDLDDNGGGDGDIDNTATGVSDQTTPQAAVEAVAVVQSPALGITKIADVADVDEAGDIITYTVSLTNTGNTTLTGANVNDPLLADLDCDGTPGAPFTASGFTISVGSDLTCTGSYTVQQNDLDTNGGGDGDIDNLATAGSDQTGTQDASETVNIVLGPALTLTKSIASGDPYAAAGDSLNYEYLVENTGNVALAGPVSVSDDKAAVTCPDVNTIGNNDGNLDSAESLTCTASYLVTQADLDLGSVTNTATASADGIDSNPDSAVATASQSPAFTITKDADVASVDEAGDIVNYSITLTNTGNVTLTGVGIGDSRLAGLSCTPAQPASLAPADDITCTGSYTVTQTDLNAGGTLDNTATGDSDQTASQDAVESVTVLQQPLIGVAKQVTGLTEVSTGTYDVTFEFMIRNYGNVPLSAVQLIDDLTATFPAPTTFIVQSLVSPDFAVNGAYDGDGDTNLLAGTDILDVGESGALTLVVRVPPANAGPFENSATASGTSPASVTVNDDSQDGANPDENANGDPTDDAEPTPIDFGPNIFDPPFGIKVFDDSGLPALRWTLTWINDSNVVAVNASVSDPIPAGTTYSAAGAASGYPVPGGAPAGSTNVGVTCEADPTSVTTITTLCYFEGPSATYPLGRIVWQGELGPDPGTTNAGNAANELIIRFNVVVDTGITSVFNTATIDSDLDGNSSFADPGEQAVASASAQWDLVVDPGVSRLPDTGFAPGRLTPLAIQPETLTYAATDLVLEIPSLNQSVGIVGVPYTARGWDVTWLGKRAGYLDGTAFPTWAGNSVITGHAYLPDGLPGPFVSLGQLKYGDRIVVHLAGQRYIYEVRQNKIVSPQDRSVFRHEDYSWLTLVTCKDFNETTDRYLHRVAVRAVLISVESD